MIFSAGHLFKTSRPTARRKRRHRQANPRAHASDWRDGSDSFKAHDCGCWRTVTLFSDLCLSPTNLGDPEELLHNVCGGGREWGGTTAYFQQKDNF